MAVMDVGRRRTVGITGTDVGLMSAAGRNGMGTCDASGSGEDCFDFATAGDSMSPWSLSQTGSTLVTSDTSTYNSGFNWGSLVNNLIGAGTRLGTQALATPGTTILPNGTVIAGTPQGTSALTGSGVNVGSSGVLLIAAVGIGLMLMLGGRR